MLDVDGNVKALEWVSGLNGPKGMGIFGEKLFVTDIDQLVVIDIQKAEIMERIPVEGASFLNDISIDKDGTVYFSDSDSGRIWKYKGGQMEAWITEGLDRPNGLFVEDSRVLLTCSGSSDMKVIDKATGDFKTVTTDIGHGDGVEYTGKEGFYIVSSWAGEVFLVLPDYSRISLLKTSEQNINSADIGFYREKQVVYVPTFFDNRVVAYRLSD
jgi:WD40 repeat protein